eukprot:scaffold4802_cov267-Chaetoceros_neogracile.AAC.26
MDRLGTGSQIRGLLAGYVSSETIGAEEDERILSLCAEYPSSSEMATRQRKKGGAVGIRDAPLGQPPRKKRKLEDLDNDLAAMIHDEGEEGIDDINANDYGNDNCNAPHTSGCVG